MIENEEAGLVTETVKKAKKCRQIPEACIHHSDLGFQIPLTTPRNSPASAFSKVFREEGNQVIMPGGKVFIFNPKKRNGILASFQNEKRGSHVCIH